MKFLKNAFDKFNKMVDNAIKIPLYLLWGYHGFLIVQLILDKGISNIPMKEAAVGILGIIYMPLGAVLGLLNFL